MGGDPRAGRADWHATRARPADASGYVERDGARIFWETFGSGGPAILILPTWSVLHAAHGRFQIADLARDHRVITFDGRGNGRSDRPHGAEAYSDEEFVADAVAVLDATGTDQAVVVACSQATHWLLRLAAEHPTRVQGAVFSGTNLPLAPGHKRPGAGPFDEPYQSTDGWAKWNAAYWRDDYEGGPSGSLDVRESGRGHHHPPGARPDPLQPGAARRCGEDRGRCGQGGCRPRRRRVRSVTRDG